MRKMLSPAFSQSALLDQEYLISGIVDQFIQVIGKKGHPGSNGINMAKWYEMVAFDILGEMALGETFHSIETGKPHFWADIILKHLYFICLADNLRRIGAISTIFSREQVKKRLASKESRKDFVSLLAQKVRKGELDEEEMAAHVSTLVLAGGETVSTILTGSTYLLLKHPEKLKRLVVEIRGAFKSYDDIKAQPAQQLEYLQAVINEGFRLLPPGPHGSARISPGFSLHGQYIPEGTEIHTSPWAAAHDPRYFAEPMEFRPERWIDPNSTDTKEASQPFSIGPRGCPGRKQVSFYPFQLFELGMVKTDVLNSFAYLEVNLLLAKILWTYDLELMNKEVDWLKEGKAHLLWWKPKLFVRFHKRSDLS
ncbi:hypothetical protein FQN54_007008 [Arachnomyces sp. PD_36]|nr:hypothetical protein FQN54_007008 [Arachnomyces sp. PD_36]